MRFSADRDLLALEPELFRDVFWAGQQRLRHNGSVSGTTLELSGGDLVAAGVSAGDVVVGDGTAMEVIGVESPTVATVSAVRADVDDPPIPPRSFLGKLCVFAGFGAQRSVAHGQILRMAGIDPDSGDGPGTGGRVHAGQIVGGVGLRLLEALGTLHVVFSAASSLHGPGSALWERAERYRRRYAQHRAGAAVHLDLDGDGVADATRRLGVAPLVRG